MYNFFLYATKNIVPGCIYDRNGSDNDMDWIYDKVSNIIKIYPRISPSSMEEIVLAAADICNSPELSGNISNIVLMIKIDTPEDMASFTFLFSADNIRILGDNKMAVEIMVM